MPDGASNTIMFTEKYGRAGNVENLWAIPRSSRFFDPAQDTGGLTYDRPPQLGVPYQQADGGRPCSYHPGASLVVMADGRVVPIVTNFPDTVWRQLVEPADGKKLPEEWWPQSTASPEQEPRGS